MATNIEKTDNIAALDQLNAKAITVAAVEDTLAESVAEMFFESATLDTFATASAAEAALLDGRAHAYLATLPEVKFLAIRHAAAVDVPLGEPLLASSEAMAVKRGDQGAAQLSQRVGDRAANRPLVGDDACVLVRHLELGAVGGRVMRMRAAVVVIAALASATSAAQDEPPAEEQVNEVDEIIVIAPRPGDRRRVDEDIANDPERVRIMREYLSQSEDQDELEWRLEQAVNSPSRIRLGYDPADEYELRNEIDIHSLPSENNKPATLFRFRF